MLSGESLIDNEPYRTKLLKTFPQAEGGEMEGTGVFSAAHQKGIEWILVKGICDFADGKKSLGKKTKQRTAATSAVSLCAHVFSQPGTFDDLGCIDLSYRPAKPAKPVTGHMQTEEALFEVYARAYERAYLSRSIDDDITAVVGRQGLWISGPSGCGKTNALMRNLSVLDKKCDFIDLGRCVGETVPKLFECLHLEIAEKVGVSVVNRSETSNNNDQSYYLGQIAKLIADNVKVETHILIDEIPLDGTNFGAFAEGIAAVVIKLANQNFHKVSFYLATIDDPEDALSLVKTKLRARMRLMKMAHWSDHDLSSLINQIAKLLPLKLSTAEKKRVVTASNGCPRNMKLMLKNWCMFRNTPGWSLDRVISESLC